MAAWLTVYCKRSLAHVTAAAIAGALADADLHTRAEGYDLPEEQADAALANLRVEAMDSSDGRFCKVSYRPGQSRPLFVYRWAAKDGVDEELAEALEDLSPDAELIRPVLAQTVEVAAVELGWNQVEDMGLVLGVEIARYLAEQGEGLLKDQEDDWWLLDGHFKPIT
jgi:hypothetical protein